MDVLILAGGKGTRLKGILDDRQKPMAVIGGRPFIEWIILSLKRQGVKEVVICTGYLNETVESYFQEREDIGMKIRFSREDFPLGTAGALRNALDKTSSKHLLVLNGDSYFRLDISSFLKRHVARNAEVSMILTTVKDSSRYGSVSIDTDGEVLAFLEKSKDKRTGLINAGVYIFERKIITKIPEGKMFSLETDFFPNLIGKGLYAVLFEGLFIDIGIPEDFHNAEKFLKNEFTYLL